MVIAQRLRTSAPRLAYALLLCFSFAPLAHAQSGPVSWTLGVQPTKKPVSAGVKFTARLSAGVSGGWHLYSLTQSAGGPSPTRITVPGDQPFKLVGAIRGPKPKLKYDENFQLNTETYGGPVAFTLPLEVAAGATPGRHTLRVEVRFQACTETTCLPPRNVTVEAAVEVTAAQQPAVAHTTSASTTATPNPSPKMEPSPRVSPPPAAPAAPSGSAAGARLQPRQPAGIVAAPDAGGAQSDRQRGPEAVAPTYAQDSTVQGGNSVVMGGAPYGDRPLLSFLWLAMTMGALSLLTPCVFPMVPITVSYFTGRSAAGRRAAAADALVYALGIVLTFTALGVLLALIAGAAGIGRFASNPWVNLTITAIFLAFALSLFGAFQIQIPSRLLTRLDDAGRGRGRHAGTLLMGLTFTLTSFTCTAPFVGTLLVVAAGGEWLRPVVGMLGFSVAFAAPFFVLALAPRLLSRLPRSGGWLNSVKVVMGLLEVAAAMKFLSNADLVWGWGVFTREVVLASWAAVALLVTAYLLGKFRTAHDGDACTVGAARVILSVASLSLGFYLLTGLFGARLGELESFLPPKNESAQLVRIAAAAREESEWIVNDYDAALAQARAAGKPVFVDFTGYTCTNCRWMEANMFTRPEVSREMSRFVLARLYTDGEGEVFERQQRLQQEKFGTVALPLYGVVDGGGNVLSSFPGLTRESAGFVAFLRAAGGEGRMR